MTKLIQNVWADFFTNKIFCKRWTTWSLYLLQKDFSLWNNDYSIFYHWLDCIIHYINKKKILFYKLQTLTLYIRRAVNEFLWTRNWKLKLTLSDFSDCILDYIAAFSSTLDYSFYWQTYFLREICSK